MISMLLNRPCSIVRKAPSGTEDAYGNEIDAETVVSTVCELQQRQRSEDETHNELSRTVWMLFLPVGTDIDSGDTVTVDGEDYELDGDAWAVRNPRTQQMSHVEATVVRVSGAYDDAA